MPIDVSTVMVLSSDLLRTGGHVGVLASSVVRKTAFGIESTAKSLAAVDTGFMRNSIGTDITGSAATVTAVVGPTASYAPYVELGTSRMAPQPFMGPATDKHLPAFYAALGRI